MRIFLVVLALLLALGSSAMRVDARRVAQVPVLEIQPNPVTGGEATVTGKNFCGGAGCSGVTITIGERVAATGIPVDSAGAFTDVIPVTEGPGLYVVVATQTIAGGAVQRAEASMSVPTQEDGATPPGVTPTAAPTPPPNGTTGASPAPSPGAQKTPTPTPARSGSASASATRTPRATRTPSASAAGGGSTWGGSTAAWAGGVMVTLAILATAGAWWWWWRSG